MGVVRHRVVVVVVAALLTAGFAAGLTQLRMDPDSEAYVPQHHPIRRFWNEARDSFGIGREIIVAVEADGPEGVFTPEILAGVAGLTDAVKEIDGVNEGDVRSLTDAEAVTGTDDGLDIEPFYDEPLTSQDQARSVRGKVFENPVYVGRLVSEDGSIAAIIVSADQQGPVEPSEIYRRVAERVAAHEIPGTRILVGGNPAIEYWFGRQMAAELTELVPLSLFVVIAVLFLCFPSATPMVLLRRAALIAVAAIACSLWFFDDVPWTKVVLAVGAGTLLTGPGVALPTLIVATSVVWTWGLQALLGMPVYVAGTMVPALLLAIGCADGIHVLERYYETAREGLSAEQTVVAAMLEVWRPVVLTSITTAVGFGSLVLGRMAVYQVFGFTLAFGILIAMLLSLSVLPALLAMVPLSKVPHPQNRRREFLPSALAGLGAWIERNRIGVVGSGLLTAVVFAVASAWLFVDYSWVESLEPSTPALEADRVLRSKLGGTMPLNVIVRAREPEGIKDPVLLRAMDSVLDDLARDPMVGDTRSLAEYVRRMNKAMNGDRPEELRIPASRDLVAQYLLLYSLSGDASELDDMVDYAYQSANLSVLLRTDSMREVERGILETERLLDLHVRSLGASATITGPAVFQYTVLNMIVSSQVASLLTAASLVFGFVWLLLGSLTVALICMLPPVFTSLVNFGVMGAIGIPLGPDRAMVSAIALGIGIDYSIHLLAHFRDLVERGEEVDAAVVIAMRTTGRAILFNGLVVVTGFAVLGMSRSPTNAVFGWMIAGNMAVACVAALILVPACVSIIGHLDSDGRRSVSSFPRSVRAAALSLFCGRPG